MKPTHEELAAARNREDWGFLWRAAIPLVKFTIKKMMRKGEIEPHGSTEDVLQEGMLAAGAAIRSWVIFDAAFSTWITLKVRGALIDYLNEQNNGGIGSRRVSPIVVSLQESRLGTDIDEDTGEEMQVARARIESLTYEPGSGFPEPEAATSATQIRDAVYAIEAPLLRDVLVRTYGFEGEPESSRDLAARYGVSTMTAHRSVVAAKKLVTRRLRSAIPVLRGGRK